MSSPSPGQVPRLDAVPSVREQVVRRLGFELDRFQREAFEALEEGASVLVSAPTGSGKTAVADYAVALALDAGTKAFYTTPLKALSNQKLSELQSAYGEERVGLLTGDTSIRAGAPVVVMTTEVLRNMIYAGSELLRGLGTVILDEVHFLQDPYRGSVWEEVIILAPPGVSFVCLSATVSNAEELGSWITERRGLTRVVIERSRPIALRSHVAVADARTRRVDLVEVTRDGALSEAGSRLDERSKRQRALRGPRNRGQMASPRRTELVEALSENDMLPAIVFIFSRKACDDAVRHCVEDGVRLVSGRERVEIRRRCEELTQGISDGDLEALGDGSWASSLEAGVAAHHAGMVPAFRRTVESCFAEGLLKVVFATETLALGINMPARSVVVERLQKVRAGGRAVLDAGDFAQLTGRAGRRGLDSVGHAVVPWRSGLLASDVARLATSPAPDLHSSFRSTYNLAVNLVRRYPAEKVHYVVDRSFAQFLDKGHHAALSGRLDRVIELLAGWGYVDITPWRLTERGETLARVFHECDLLVAECLACGLLDGVEAPALAALVSGFCFEARTSRTGGSGGPGGPRGVGGPGGVSRLRGVGGPAGAGRPRGGGAPGGYRRAGRAESVHRVHGLGELSERAQEIEAVSERLAEAETRSGLLRTRRVDFTLARVLRRWASGEQLGKVLGNAEVAPGDFVRSARQVADLLRQIVEVGRPGCRGAARQAVQAIDRGVVASEVHSP